jgi:hypothetical protein
MALDLQSLFGLLCTESLAETWLRPRNSPPHSAFGFMHIRGRQDRRRLFVTPWEDLIMNLGGMAKISTNISKVLISHGLNQA